MNNDSIPVVFFTMSEEREGYSWNIIDVPLIFIHLGDDLYKVEETSDSVMKTCIDEHLLKEEISLMLESILNEEYVKCNNISLDNVYIHFLIYTQTKDNYTDNNITISYNRLMKWVNKK